jgi:DNA-binding PadR family transcriptional regulator
MLELAVLGLLKERTMHGYQLKKRLAETLGSFWQVSYGSLYPALRRMQEEGAVQIVLPKEGVGRRKNVYRITDKGQEMFQALLEEAGHDTGADTTFQVRLAFFRYLKPETRIGMLERRRAYLEGRLDDLKRSIRDYRERIDEYTASLMRHGVAATEHDIQWLEGLIASERRAVRSNRGGRTRPRRRNGKVRPADGPASRKAARAERSPSSPLPQKERAS